MLRPGRFVFACSLGLAGGCGLVFSPGEYGGEGASVVGEAGVGPTPGAESGASPDGETGTADASGRAQRLLVVAGRRPQGEGETGLQLVVEGLGSSLVGGELGPWTYDLAPPVPATWTRARTADGLLFLQKDTTVYRATFDGGSAGAWSTIVPRSGAVDNGGRPWLFAAGLVSAGGFAGSSPTTNVQASTFSAGGGDLDPWRTLPTSKLAKARAEVTLHRHGDWLFAIGGRDAVAPTAPSREEVDVAQVGADGLPGNFAATQKMGEPGKGAHGVQLPSVASGAGYLFVAGGLTTGQGSSMTDVVLAAPIDEATGKLGAWVTPPKLPAPLVGAAAIVVEPPGGDRMLLVIGGTGASAPSDDVLALPLFAGGTFGAWKRLRPLPGPRSGLVAVAY